MTCHAAQVFSLNQCTQVTFLVLAILFLFHRITVIYYQHSRLQHKSFLTACISISVMRAVSSISLFVIFLKLSFEWTYLLMFCWPLGIFIFWEWTSSRFTSYCDYLDRVSPSLSSIQLSFFFCASLLFSCLHSLYLSAYSYFSLLLFSLSFSLLLFFSNYCIEIWHLIYVQHDSRPGKGTNTSRA